jgi:hypothetical protein
VSLGQQPTVVPDGERKPDDQMTPAELLAALGGDDYEEDSDHDETAQNDEAEIDEDEL